MKQLITITFCYLIVLTGLAQPLKSIESKRIKLSNGWNITPIGKSLPLGDLPLNMAISNSKKYMAITNNGQSIQTLQLIDITNEKILDNMGIPKTIYSDQGSEFKNNTFQKVLDKHKIQIIFALEHAPFVESFNKTMKNRMMKYMKLKNTDNWSKIMGPVLDAYNNTPHSTTKIAPNKVNKENEVQVLMNINKKANKGKYPELEVGDNVRVPVINKVHKGYKDSFSMEVHKIEEKNRGLYKVDGFLHPRKDLQLIKGNIIKAPTKTKAQQNKHYIQDKVGKSQNNPEVKDLIGNKTKKEIKEMLDSGRKTRSQTSIKLRDTKI